jgi:peptidoglycan/xylan/chitin deacetylase (PgdA/CDA1 family)
MSKRKKIIIKSAASVIAISIFLYARSQYVLPIVMYHSVKPQVPGQSRLIVSTEAFERQMAFLKKYKYSVLALEEAAQIIKDNRPLPPRPIVITIDDGNLDNYTYAFAILKKYGLPATIFLPTDDIGKSDKLTWEQMREMQRTGLISFGSHTLTHPFLTEIKTEDLLWKEISGSKKILESGLGRQVNTFSYPSGRFNQKARDIVIKAGYTSAVATNPGKRIKNNDVFALKRLRISENAGNLFIFWAETNGYYNLIRENRHK